MQHQANGVGKSYLSKYLVDIGIAQYHTGFAIPIKKMVYYNIYNTSLFLDKEKDNLSYTDFAQDRKNDPIYHDNLSPRDFTCAYSDMIQQFYGPSIWGKIAYRSLNKDATTIIDDWRRYTESDYLKNQKDINVITLYLDIEKTETSVDNVPSEGSSHYEGMIKAEDCDLYFKYKSNYSNFNDLIQLITDHLNKFK